MELTPKDLAGAAAITVALGWELEAAQAVIRQLRKELAAAQEANKKPEEKT